MTRVIREWSSSWVLPRGQAIDVEATSTKEVRDPAQHAGSILDQCGKDVSTHIYLYDPERFKPSLA